MENGHWMVALLLTEHKRGKVWVLPKGHVEVHRGERVSEAAGREVKEEMGLRDLSVKQQLGITRFRFQAETAVVHKTVHYYLMTTGQKELTPQEEEGLLEARWFPAEEAIAQLEYDTDQNIVQRGWDHITGRSPQKDSRKANQQNQPRSSRRPFKPAKRHSRIHL